MADGLRGELQKMVQLREVRRQPLDLTLHPITAAEEPREMVAVDGSYTFLWNLGSLWLAVVRVGALRYSAAGGRFKKMSLDRIDRPIVVSTWEDVAKQQDELHRKLFQATRHSSEQHRDMVNEYRKLLEGELALQVAERSEGLLLALDGSLASFPKELDNLADVVRVAERRDHLLVGVSKDSITHAFGKALTDEEVLRTHGDTAYVRVPQEFEQRQRALLHGDVYFARMHARAMKWFRVDVGTHKDEPGLVFGHLGAYARSALSPGYPYPLMEAHRFAVTIRQFREMFENLVIEEAARLGLTPREVVDGFTEMEGQRRTAFHEFLDQVARDLK